MTSQDKARIIYEVAENMGWSDPESIKAWVQRLERGLPAEDEFSVLVSWLGHCKLVHKLDQLQFPPDSTIHFRVPDLFAIFEHNGQDYPVLIEVKKKEDSKLSWKPDYLTSLKRYSDLLDVPLLVAWKCRGFWSLFEVRHFKRDFQNYNISFEAAMKQNLMGLLVGDFSYSLQPGLSLHFRMKKLEKTPDGWNAQIEQAYFSNANGERFESAPGLLPLFLSSVQEDTLTEEEGCLVQSFVIPTDRISEFAHRSLVKLVWFAATGEGATSWRVFLQGKTLPTLAKNFLDAFPKASEAGFVQNIFRQVPHDQPIFLP